MLKLNSDLQDEKDKMLVQNTEVSTKLTPVMMLFDQQKYILLQQFFICDVYFKEKQKSKVISKLKIEFFFPSQPLLLFLEVK